jgi:hypothetical protein
MEKDLITVKMTKEQYKDMQYCMQLVKKQRAKALKYYYEKAKDRTPTQIKKRKFDIEIPVASTD